MAEYRLKEEIIALSESKIWAVACLEWNLIGIHFKDPDDPQTCLCGHFPIIEICTITNRLNRNQVEVGNCCVKKFMGLPSDLIFQGIKRIRENIDAALNEQAALYAHSKGWINDWELKFSLSTKRDRRFSSRQREKRQQINTRVLHFVQTANTHANLVQQPRRAP